MERTNCDLLSLEGWAFDSAWDIPAVLSNPPGVMRLASTQTPSYPHYATLTVKKLLNGGMGVLTVSTFFTTYSGTSVQLWVAYADGSTETIYVYGTTPSTPSRNNPGLALDRPAGSGVWKSCYSSMSRLGLRSSCK